MPNCGCRASEIAFFAAVMVKKAMKTKFNHVNFERKLSKFPLSDVLWASSENIAIIECTLAFK